MKEKKKRLSKVLSGAGISSRRKAETLIFSKRVAVNGSICVLPQTLVDPMLDEITVDGSKVVSQESFVYYILNKPIGFLCSHERRSKNGKLIYDLFRETPYRLFSVGRLDKDTEGLLIVTNDGQFAHQVIHPSSNNDKEYVVKTDQEITDAHLKTISAGVRVEGSWIRPKQVVKIRKGTLKIVIKEGKKHEVRHLIKAANLEILHLKRTRIGDLRLDNLPIGHWREMTEREKKVFTK